MFPPIFNSLFVHRRLILQLTKREVLGRYRGSFIGVLWSFINPVLMLAVYTFFFTVVFTARWGSSTSTNRYEFALVLFAGLIVYNLFSECLSRAPGLVLNNANYVKKVIFPIDILPWVCIGSALFHAAISVLVLLLFQLLVHHSLPWTIVLLPLVLLPLLILLSGVCWVLASLGVFVRDIGQTMGMLTTALMFLSPIFYPVSALPSGIREFLFLNPLTLIIEQVRNVVLWGVLPDWIALGVYLLVSLLLAMAGWWWFQKTRKGFADVL